MIFSLVVVGVVGMIEPNFQKEAVLAWEKVDRDFFDSSTGLYREFYSTNLKEKDPAFNWTVGVTLSALNGIAQSDLKARTQLAEYLKKVDLYWNSSGPVAGFDVLPNAKGVDRYYDDNAWMVLALLESYEILKDEKILLRAKQSLDYVLSGEDLVLGGGIYWRESDKASKNTCSNSPSAVACFEMYKRTHEIRYRDAGYRILDWTMKYLYDSSERLMSDSLALDGKVDQTKWSYNSALTIRALGYAEANGKKYQISSREMFEAAWERWHDTGGHLKGPGKFSHLLFETGLTLKFLDSDRIRAVGSRVLETRFGDLWGHGLDQMPGSDQKRFDLIDQASAVRVLTLANRFLGAQVRG